MPNETVSVIGQINEGMGGLKESLGAFRKHHIAVGDALLNISGVGTATGAPVDKHEARPPYKHDAYPAMLFHADGRQEIVEDAESEKELKELGFRPEPYLKPRVALHDPHQEKKELLDRNRELGAQVTILTETLQKLQEQVAALSNKKGK